MLDIRGKLILEILEQFISQQNKFSVSTYPFFFFFYCWNATETGEMPHLCCL